MTRRPLRITLAGAEWTVRETTQEKVESAYHDGRGCPKGRDGCIDAWTDRDARTIWLRDDLDEEGALRATLHEWAHVELPRARHKRIYRIDEELGALLSALGWTQRGSRRAPRRR